jgi:2',3'-cyclic-nucleotide 2'-phosphodiesterase (5'-nucleotidase family)
MEVDMRQGKISTRLLLAWLLVLVWLPILAAAQEVSLTLLHTNDTHGHLLPFSYPVIAPAGTDEATVPVRTDIGGIARRATLVRQIRAELEPRGTPVWLVDAGDFTDGSAFSAEYQGEADVAAMNAAGYDLATLGNHEFGRSLATLKRLLAQVRYPILCANVTETATGKLLIPATLLRKVGPITIGLFGLVTKETAGYQAITEGLTLAGEIETAQAVVAKLRQEADFVILLSHAGEQMDEQIAAAVPGIDVIVGGHSHTRLPVGAFVWRTDALKPKDVNGTIIVQAHQWGGELGRLDLLIEKDEGGVWHAVRYRARLLPVTAALPEEPTVAAVIARYWAPIAPRYTEVLAQATGDFSDRGDDLTPYNLVADAVRATVGTEIEVENLGGVRAPLLKGPITQGNLAELDPFDNRVLTFRITGLQLKTLVQKHRPAVSGVRYRIEEGQLTELTVTGQPVDEVRMYTGATNSFFGPRGLPGVDLVDSGRLRRDVVAEYLRKQGLVRPVYDGRRVIIGP